jgi:hypothetical protein
MSQIRCRAGKACICKGMTVKERFDYFDVQLRELQEGDNARRRQILDSAHPCMVQLLCEIGLNLLKGNIQLPDRQYKSLKPYKRLLIKLCAPRKTLKERKKILYRALSGLLPKILPFVLTAVSSFGGQALAKAIF